MTKLPFGKAQGKPFDKVTLKNGVRLMMIPMVGVNSVATSVMVGVGSRYEMPQINGISHFLEHMVFKGTKKYPTMEDVMKIERAGGLQNAYTDINSSHCVPRLTFMVTHSLCWAARPLSWNEYTSPINN